MDEGALFERIPAGGAAAVLHHAVAGKILAGGRLAGFFYVLRDGRLAYIFHFAIHQDFRGRGVGTSALKALLERCAGERLFLAIEQIDPAAENFQVFPSFTRSA